MSSPTSVIKYVPVKDLKPHPSNPRLIKDEKFKKLCDSILHNTKYFEARPIIYSNRTGENIIIAGNMRYKAAKHLQRSVVPAVLIEDLTEKEEQEIMVKDNLHHGEFDWDVISSEFEVEDLLDWGFDEKDLLDEPKKEAEIRNAGEEEEKHKCPSCGCEF